MNADDINRAMVREAAQALGSLREQVVFVGGAVAGLLITDPIGIRIRPTNDVDCVIEVGSRLTYLRLSQGLFASGWRQNANDPICRFRKGPVVVDIMPTDPGIVGFGNRWASEAITFANTLTLEEVSLKVISAPYFVASKLDAFMSRGEGNLSASHDIEDIITIIDGRKEIVDETKDQSSEELRGYFKHDLGSIVDALADVIPFHLPPDLASQGRAQMIEERLRALTTLC